MDVKHNIIHFKKETEKIQEIDYIASIVQNELPQDRYRYFIFPQAKFAEWTEWSDCDVSCGGGTIMRERPCVSYFAKMNHGFTQGFLPRPDRNSGSSIIAL